MPRLLRSNFLIYPRGEPSNGKEPQYTKKSHLKQRSSSGGDFKTNTKGQRGRNVARIDALNHRRVVVIGLSLGRYLILLNNHFVLYIHQSYRITNVINYRILPFRIWLDEEPEAKRRGS